MALLKTSFLFLSSLKHQPDRTLSFFLAILAALSGLLLLLVILFLAKEAWPGLTNGGWRSFLTHKSWYPLEGMFGIFPMIWASLAMMFGAVLIAIPLGLSAAIVMRFYIPPTSLLAQAYRLILGLLAGIPSVVYGLWGLTVLVPLIGQLHPPGASLLAAILILALMILPTIALTALAALEAIPKTILSGAAALGMSQKGQILSVALPAARMGIIGGILLSMARALGETMAVLMVAGNVVQNPDSLFAPVRALTANIALEMAYATSFHRASLFASGLLLTFLVFLLSWFASRNMGNNHYG